MPQRDPHLQKLIDDLKTKKFREGEAKSLTQTYGEEISKQLKPLFTDLSKEVTFAVKDAFKNLKVDVPKSEIPQVNMPEFPQIPPFPEMKAPIVNVPAPIVNIPAPIVNVSPSEVHFPSEMSLRNGDKPFPVMMMDLKGKPMQFPVVGGSSGPGFPMRVLDESTNALRVTGTVSVASSNSSTQSIDSSGNAYSQANPLPVVFSSTGSTASALIDSSGIQYSGSNPLPVTITSGASATSASNIVDSSGVAYSGSNPLPITGPVVVTSITNSVASALVDSSGVAYSGSNPLPIVGPVVVTSVTNTVAAANVDSSGAQYSGSNPFPYTLVTSATASMNVALTDSGGVQYSGSNPLPITGPVVVTSITNTIAAANVDSSGVLYSGSNPFPFSLVTNATSTLNVALTDSGGIQYSGSNPLPTTATISLPAGPGDGATATRFIQAGDTVSSMNILQINGATPATGLNETTAGVLRMVHMTDTSMSANIATIGGTAPATGLNETTAGVLRVTIMTDTAQSANVTAFNGNAPATGLNETTSGVLRIVQMSDTVSSVYANNPFGQGDVATALRVVQAGNVASSVMSAATGLNETTVDVIRVVTMSDTASSVQAKIIGRTTNPTALADAASGFQSADKLGRALNRPIQVRDLIKTAYVALSTGTETTLLTAAAGTFADLIMLTATNNSTVATQLDIRATTAGNILHTMYLPASTGPVGFAPAVPWPQDSTGNSWTIDMPDQTGTTVYVSALFSQEI